MAKFLNSVAGSWLKVFLVAVLIKYSDIGGDLFSLDKESIKHLINAGFLAVIPVAINFLNPLDTRYGVNKVK